MNRRRPLALIAGAVLLASCQPSPASVELTIYAAASLTDALAEIEAVYEAANPGVDLVIATDSSAALRTQIQEGAPADVFLSADIDHPAALAEQGLVDGTVVEYAANRLALVVPTANEVGIRTPADLATAGVQVIAAGPEVPITAYAAEVVGNLAALPGYPTGFAEAYAANVVSEEENVRAVLARIELNEGDAGFVYRTDALASTAVSTIEIPEEANTRAIYAGCVIAHATSPDEGSRDAARAFLEWVAGPGGQDILAQVGFESP